VEALVRGTHLHDFARQDRGPLAVDLDLIVIAHLATRGRTAVGKIAARDLGFRRHQALVEIPVPLVMTVTEVAILGILGERARTQVEEDGSEQVSHANLLSMDRIVRMRA
jgi:hypothetical protein